MFFFFQNTAALLICLLVFSLSTTFKRVNSDNKLNLLLMKLTFVYLILTELISELKNSVFRIRLKMTD